MFKMLFMVVLLPLLLVGLTNFKDLKNTFNPAPYDLKQGQQYIDKLVSLSANIDNSCSSQDKRYKREASSLFSVLGGIIEAHATNPEYKSLAYMTKNLKRNALFKACS